MNIPVYKRLEIAFWDFAIQTLSENDRVRGLVKISYRLTHSAELKRVLRVLAASAAAGLVSGFLLCVATVYFWK